MPHTPPPADAPTDDTPVDERPPYGGGPSRGLVALIIVAVLIAVAIFAVVVFVALLRRVRRAVCRPARSEVIMFAEPDRPYVGRTYRVLFFDDTYPQLTDRRLSVALTEVHGPAADAALDRLARQLQDEVERRDAQRCFRPRVELYDGVRLVRSWSVV